jgi:hypothetical protein
MNSNPVFGTSDGKSDPFSLSSYLWLSELWNFQLFVFIAHPVFKLTFPTRFDWECEKPNHQKGERNLAS